jgi:hypothetical protein
MAARLAGWQGGPGPGPTPTPSGPALVLHPDKTVFSASGDHIAISADVSPASGFTPFIRFATPDGAFLYLVSGGGIVPGRAGGGAPYLAGPLSLGESISGYGVADLSFGGIAPGTYTLQGALVGMSGIVGGVHETALVVQ